MIRESKSHDADQHMAREEESLHTIGSTLNSISYTNNNRTTALERKAAQAMEGGGLKCILLAPNLSPRFCYYLNVKLFSSHGGFFTNTIDHHRETIESN